MRNSLGKPLQNSPPSICLVRRCWKVLARCHYVPLRWTHRSSPSCDLGVCWRSLFRLRHWPCLCLPSSGCWSLFALFRWTSSPRRYRWLDGAVGLGIRWLQSVDAHAPFSVSALYDQVLVLPLQDAVLPGIRCLKRTVRSISSHEHEFCFSQAPVIRGWPRAMPCVWRRN